MARGRFWNPGKVPTVCPVCGREGAVLDEVFYHRTFAQEAECEEVGRKARVAAGEAAERDAERKERGRRYFMSLLRRENEDLRRENARLRSAETWKAECRTQGAREEEQHPVKMATGGSKLVFLRKQGEGE